MSKAELCIQAGSQAGAWEPEDAIIKKINRELVEMNKTQLREIVQLMLAAKHFYYISKRQFAKLSQGSKQTKIIDLARKFENEKWSKNDNYLLILVSYLSSCGIRISTIYEGMNIKPKELYSNRLDHKNICHFLRDNVCHKEPGDEDKEYFKKRQRFLEGLTIEQLYDDVSKAFKVCKENIIEFSNNYKVLEGIIKNKFKII